MIRCFHVFLFFVLCLGATRIYGENLAKNDSALLPGFQRNLLFPEQMFAATNTNGVRIVINAPESLATNKPLKLIIYTLPNGNSIEQTIGKKVKEGEDWHFNIQHIGAQTRFLREMLPEENIVVAYLEANTSIAKAWPAWRKKNDDKEIPLLVDSVKSHFSHFKTSVILAGHSGGGSFIFGYINCFEKIPDDVERIAFLDSNYGYETGLHKMKLVNWLKASPKHFLTILAYHDDIALLNGKTFVSAAGGTWGKSHLMTKDFAEELKLEENISSEWEKYSALDGRLKFFLRENPEKKIYHTVQVERNGFIHAMVTGTPRENHGYEYFGEKVYEKFIQPE